MHLTFGQLFDGIAELPTGLADKSFAGVADDSRKVKPGDLFFALEGSKTDGRRHVDDARRNGAAAVVAESLESGSDLPHIVSANPRRTLALLAARLFPEQPETLVAVTGTNGKTSVAVFVRQIWEAMGFRAASLGTTGVIGPGGTRQSLAHTTPGPLELHSLVATLRNDHIKHLVLEASSHGLAQHRLDGLRFTAGAFTNLTHDHLDYHPSFEAYFDAKMRLFEELLPQGGSAVLNADTPHGANALARSKNRGLITYTVGKAGEDIKLLSVHSEGLEQHIKIRTRSGEHSLTVPLAGAFQVSNALVAAGLVIASGGEEHLALHALQSLKGAPGRLECVGKTEQGGHVFVDYAHTPDALENVLNSLRPFTNGKLITVFGCGGDRDKTKRPLMGRLATRLSNMVIVTDDNPRSENPAGIRREILAAANGAREIADRAEAIRVGVSTMGPGDILLVAGKGHEEGQVVGSKVLPFRDHDAVAAALRGEIYHG
jgi:UDP-N-acetylmuramoyl-L-alanyl-D-glutamate--2,6-diaminopimelate ligase